jgi:outer membrane protein OmpA-like peptidoglycan-associated protein
VRQQFTALSVEPDSLQITPTIRADGGVDSWSVEVSNNKGEVLDRVSEPGTAVSPVMLSLGRRYFTPGTESLRIEVRAADRNGRRLSTEKSVPVRMISETKKAGEDVDDYRIERYSLMLFDFNKSDLTSGHREVLESLRGKLVAGSSVTIEGYTDRSGDASYNRGLAERRCQEVKSYLLGSRTDIPVAVRAVGSDRLLYDNSTPEGRSYSRTVIVEIKTPIKK